MTNNQSEETSNSLPWYKEGLRFECTQCGKCCTGSSGIVWVSVPEMVAMAEVLRISLDLFKRKYTKQRDNRFALVDKKSQNHDCVFLKDKKCEVYKARPNQCRNFPWWPENLHSEKSWELAAESCEGINDNAPLVPYSQIVQILNSKKDPLLHNAKLTTEPVRSVSKDEKN